MTNGNYITVDPDNKKKMKIIRLKLDFFNSS